MPSKRSVKAKGKNENAGESNSSANQENILELCKVLNDDGSISEITQPTERKDVLKEIDKLVGDINVASKEKEDTTTSQIQPINKRAKKEQDVQEDFHHNVETEETNDTPTTLHTQHQNVSKNSPVSEEIISEEKASEIRNMLDTVKGNLVSEDTEKDITLRALTTELLTPLLKDWINKNLSDIVKECVEKAINDVTHNNNNGK